MAQNHSRALLKHITGSIIILIHECFVRPHTLGHKVRDSLDIKHILEGEGIWCTEKEILGCIFNVLKFCISLNPHKVKNIKEEIKKDLNPVSLYLQKFQKLV